MNLISSGTCCICLGGKPDSDTYNGDWVFKPNAKQRANGIRHIKPVIMHRQSPRKEINPDTGELQIAMNSRTGNPLRGTIHWCCEDCLKTVESREDSDEYPCPMCRKPVIKRDVLEQMAILDDILANKCTRALNTLKRLYAGYSVQVHPVNMDKINHLIIVAGESLKNRNGQAIFRYILELGVLKYDTDLVMMSAATSTRNAAALQLCYDFATESYFEIWEHEADYLMYFELEKCLADGSKNIEFVNVFLDNGADPLFVKLYANDKVEYMHRPVRKTAFTLFLETARDLDKSMECLYHHTYLNFMQKISQSKHILPWSTNTLQQNINRMFSDKKHDSHFNPYTWVGNVSMLSLLESQCTFDKRHRLFPVAIEINNKSAMFDFIDFLQDDFESVILPRLEFFYRNNVNFNAIENGLTPITSVLNDVYFIEIQTLEQVKNPHYEFDVDTESKIREAQHKRVSNIKKMTKYFLKKGVSIRTMLKNTRSNAATLAEYLKCFSYHDGLIDLPQQGWLLDRNGNVRDCFFAFADGHWNPLLDHFVNLFDLPRINEILTLYLGNLSPKTACIYLENIMQEINIWECDDLELFFHVLSNDVIAYNEREKLNDLEKKKSSIPTDVQEKHFGWHPILQNIFTQLSRSGFFELEDIAQETIEQLKSFPMHIVKSIFDKAMSMYQVRDTRKTFPAWIENIITSCC